MDVDGSHYTTWCFGHVIKDESYLSFHVIRSEFDHILLRNAQQQGVQVHEQTTAKDVIFDTEGPVEVHAVDADGETRVFRARFLLDASGQRTFLANRMKWKRPHDDLDRVALFTHWTGATFIERVEEGLLQIIQLGGEKKGWIWAIPVGTDRLSVGVVINNAYLKKEKARLLKEGEDNWQEALYCQELGFSAFVTDLLKGAQMARTPNVTGNDAYLVEKKYGDNFALIGDASTFIDPIFASEVFLAMNSARLISEALDKKFSATSGTANAGLEEAYAQINGAYKLIDKLIRLFYNPESISFAQMGSAVDIIHEQHETALALAHYLLAGDFFEQHEKYSEFVELVANPKVLAKYKSLVIDRPDFSTKSCGMEYVDIFAPELVAFEQQNRLA